MRQLAELILLFILCFIGHGYTIQSAIAANIHLMILALLTVAITALSLNNSLFRAVPHIAAIGFFVVLQPSVIFVPAFIYIELLPLFAQLKPAIGLGRANKHKPVLNTKSQGKRRRNTRYQQAVIFLTLGAYLFLLTRDNLLPAFTLVLVATYLAFNTYNKKVEDTTTILTVDDMREQVIELTNTSSQLSLAAEKDRALAVLQERDRIARRLHDSVGHTISSSLIQLQALDVQVEESQVKESIERIQTTLSQGMQAIRAQLYDLRDTAFDAEQTLQTIAQEITRPQIHLHYGLQECSYATKQQLVLFAKEAIANAIKHSDATELRIVLTSNQAMHIMTIKDNGTVEPPRITPGIGLGNMQTFAQEHNGQCTYHYQNGFAIHLYIERQHDEHNAC